MAKILLDLAAALVALLILGAAPAFANVERPMQTHPSPGELQAACDANGGSFSDVTVDDYHSYSCTKQNCDGKGGDCKVSCGDKGCAGSTPARIIQGNLRMILQNGSRVNHVYLTDDQDDGGTNGAPAGAAPPAAPPAPSFL